MKSIKLKAIIAVVTSALIFTAVFVTRRSRPGKEQYLQKAEAFYQNGNYDGARIGYLNLLRVDRSNATGIRRLGEIWFAGGNPLEALRYLITANELFPDDSGLRMKMAVCRLAIGHRTEARKEALAVLNKSPGDDEAILILADTTQSEAELEETRLWIQEPKFADAVSHHLASATLSLKKGEIAEVQKELEKAVELDSKSFLAHIGLGNIYWSKSDIPHADAEFKAASDLSPPRSIAGMKYAEFKAKAKQVADAKILLQNITTKTPDYLPAWMALAQLKVEEKNYDEALAMLVNILGRDPRHFEARLLKASIWLAQGETSKAEELLLALDREQPGNTLLQFQLARCYLKHGKDTQASALLDQVVASNPDHLEALLLQASVNLRRGDARAVVASMEKILKKRPGMMQPQLLLIEAYRSLARFDEAEAILRRQADANPDDAASHFLLGIVQKQKANPEDARVSFEKAFSLSPDNPFFLEQIVDLDLGEKKFDAAFERVHAEEKRAPKSAGIKFLEAKVAAAQAKWDTVEAVILDVLKLDPAFTAASDFLVPTYIAQKKFPQAIEQLERILARTPANAEALKTAALLCEETREFTKARDLYERYLSLKPDDQPVVNNLAYLYSERLNQLKEAGALARKARTLQPSDPGAADTLGWVLFKQGDYAQALALIQESSRKIGGNPEVQFHLGMASYTMGEVDAARAAFIKAQASPDAFPAKDQLPQMLGLLAAGDAKSTTSENLQPLLEKFPEDPLVRVRLGEAYEREGQHAKAAAAYELAVQKNPKLLKPLLRLTELFGGPLKDQTKAIDYGKKAKLVAPDDAAVSAALGKLAFQQGNHTWAYSLLQESVRRKGDDVATLHDFAWASYSLGKVAEAEVAMQRVITTGPESDKAAQAKTFIAMTALERQPDQVPVHEGEVNEILKADPGDVPAIMALAALQAQRGETEAAVAKYRSVLGRFPEFTPAMKHLAELYFENPENRAKAGELASKARNAYPGDPQLSALLGAISYERKDFRYAIQLLEESASKKPLDAKGLYYLGMAYLRNKDQIKGLEILKRSLTAGLAAPHAAEVRDVIRDLENK